MAERPCHCGTERALLFRHRLRGERCLQFRRVVKATGYSCSGPRLVEMSGFRISQIALHGRNVGGSGQRLTPDQDFQTLPQKGRINKCLTK